MITTATHLYAVMGDPVAHSLGPAMHNSAFEAVAHNGVYVAFRVTDIAAAVAGIRALGIRGASVTIPHKIDVMAHLDQCDDLAQKIGAVNTIVNDHGQLKGYNTDCLGSVRALETVTGINGRRTVIVGAGGAARAVAFGIREAGGRLCIANRTRKTGEGLASELDAQFIPLEEVHCHKWDILINTTSVGMSPHVAHLPIPEQVLHKEMVVMDAVYNPLETRLLQRAAEKGCVTVSGVGMFVHQGAIQFELWTGSPAPLGVMENVVLSALKKNQQK
jgi:shikimate dehydrogenase